MANLEQAEQMDSLFAAPHNLRGQIQLRLGEQEEAVRSFEKAVSLDSTSVAAWAGWGNALRQTGSPEQAKSKHEMAISLDPSYAPALVELALCHVDLGQTTEEALESLSAARDLNPMNPLVHYYLGQIHKSFDRNESAIDSYQTALEILYPGP
jgi:tetratricopeptide (TPR) repeat protein